MKKKLNLHPTTPRKITQVIRDLIRELEIDNNPLYLKFTHRSDAYTAGNCFSNCENESRLTGGKMVFGWILWEDKKNTFIEAEFHVVLSENGNIIDITPRKDNEPSILFVEDDWRTAQRIDPYTLRRWTPLKYHSGYILEHPEPIIVHP